MMMTNGEAFEYDFGIYATELWAMPEEKFLEWLNSPCDRERPRDMIVRCEDCKYGEMEELYDEGRETLNEFLKKHGLRKYVEGRRDICDFEKDLQRAYESGYRERDDKIVRCKNCKWWTKQSASLQGRCDAYGMYPTGEWYCARGERKDT